MAVKVSDLPNSNDFNGQEQVLVIQDGVSKAGLLSSFTPFLSSQLVTYDKLDEFSINWDNTHTTVQASSGDWEYTKTYVQDNSASWDTDTIGGTTQGTGSNNLNLRVSNEGNVTGLSRGEGSVDFQTSRETETQVASGANSVITGGRSNLASGEQDVIGGGYNNATYDPLGFNNVIGGGSTNYIIGYSNAIPGGTNNSIESNHSFAVGQSAQAVHDGTFIFSDSAVSNSRPFQTISANSANFKATGGLRLVDGNEAVGKVLTCVDDEGTGHWDLPEEYDHTLIEATSGNWDSTYTTVSANSASWVGGGDVDTSIQSLSALGSHTAPNPLVIDLTQGSNVEGWLTANVSLQLSGAEPGQSGLITLGNGRDHDGVGFTVDFYLDNTTNLNHTAGGHSIMAGDLADFAIAPGAGEFNFGSIGWYYDGNEYLLYVSEVKPYTASIQPPQLAATDYCLNGSETFSQAGEINGEFYYNGTGSSVLFWEGSAWVISEWITEGVDVMVPGSFYGGSDPTDPINGFWIDLSSLPQTLTAGVCP